MARNKKITLTDEHIKLISNIKFEKFLFDEKEHYSHLKDLVSELILINEECATKVFKDKKLMEVNDYTLKEINNFDPHSRFGWGIDQYNLFGGSYVLEDVAMILGLFDKAIPGTETMTTGRRFPDELEEKMYTLYEYIYENLEDIIEIVFTFMANGGVTAGTYEFKDYEWIKR